MWCTTAGSVIVTTAPPFTSTLEAPEALETLSHLAPT
jgi:hypothetical protein